MTTNTTSTNNVVRAILLLILTTFFEVAGLIIWVEADFQGKLGLGLIILYIGLVLERLSVVLVLNPANEWLGKIWEQAINILASSWWEYAAWALWFVLIQFLHVDSIGVFLLVLLPGLHFQHAFLIALDSGKSYTELVLNPGFIVFSLIEAIGGALWLAALNSTDISRLNAHLIILIAITIEHIAQGIVLNFLNKQGISIQMSRAN